MNRSAELRGQCGALSAFRELYQSKILRCIGYCVLMLQAEYRKGIAAEGVLPKRVEHEIDEIQKLQRSYGTISVKQPDIWGQARLMQQRFEFETNMAAELGTFSNRFQASQSESLSTGIKLETGITGGTATGTDAKKGADSAGNGGSKSGGQAASAGNPIEPTLEHSEYLNQKAEDINHLHALRRINEGDDTADSPGYALYLARLPISIYPGTKTRKGFGAAIEFQVSPVLTPDLLTSVFKSLVINDLVEQLAQPIAELAATNTVEAWQEKVRKLKALSELTLQTNIASSWTNIASSVSNIATHVLAVESNLVSLEQHSRLTRTAAQLADDGTRLTSAIARLSKQANTMEELSRQITNTVASALTLYGSLTNSGSKTEASWQNLKTAIAALPEKFKQLNIYLDSWQEAPSLANVLVVYTTLTNKTLLDEYFRATSLVAKLQPDINTGVAALQKQLALAGNLNAAKELGGSLSSDVDKLRTGFQQMTDALGTAPILTNEATAFNRDATQLSLSIKDINASITGVQGEITAVLASLKGADLNAPTRTKEAHSLTNLLARLNTLLTNEVIKISSEVNRVLSTNKTTERETIRRSLATQMTPFRSRNAQFAFPSTYIPDIYGEDELMSLIAGIPFSELGNGFTGATSSSASARLLTVIPYLKEQLETAYNIAQSVLLSNPSFVPNLIEAIQSLDLSEVNLLRTNYYQKTHGFANILNTTNIPSAKILSWPALVQMVLLDKYLNEQMNKEMERWPEECPSSQALPKYYRQPPSNCAFLVFSNYVSKRWPIRVFALGPTTRDQNIKDSAERQREFQLALSAALTAGKISASQYASYSRQYALDAETVRLNRTTAGFAEGGNRFGWRFYPRFQVRNITFGRDSELEMGVRECEAILIVPSFVQELDINSYEYWFQFDNPEKATPSLAETAELHRRYRRLLYDIEVSSNFKDLEYRAFLDRSLSDIGRILTSQELRIRVPHENTLGGFAMFNSSSSGLAPELTGYYGTPVLSTNESTSLFLVGNNFSVRGTRVVAGGRVVSSVNLISRQLMQIELSARLLEGRPDKSIDVYVASPYGVTRPLTIAVERVGIQPSASPPSPEAKAGPAVVTGTPSK